MKFLYQIFKKDPFLTVLGLLVGASVLWFYLAPVKFKAIWGKNPLVVEIIKEHQSVEQKNKFISIAYYYPYFPYFGEIVTGQQQPKKEWMDSYYSGKPYIFHLYYQKVVEMFPGSDSAHSLLGFCEYYLGHRDLARVQYEKSVELNPYFFWSYYNLGVIYFQQGEFLKSAEILNRAFSFKREFTIEIASQNLFYGQIWRTIANPSNIAESNLNQGAEDAKLLIAIYLIKAGRYDQTLQIIQSIGNNPWHPGLWKAIYQKALRRQRTTQDIDRLIQEQIPVRLF